MVKLGAVVSFENDLCKITRNSKLLAVGVLRGKLYVLKIMEDQVNIASEENLIYFFGIVVLAI